MYWSACKPEFSAITERKKTLVVIDTSVSKPECSDPFVSQQNKTHSERWTFIWKLSLETKDFGSLEGKLKSLHIVVLLFVLPGFHSLNVKLFIYWNVSDIWYPPLIDVQEGFRSIFEVTVSRYKFLKIKDTKKLAILFLYFLAFMIARIYNFPHQSCQLHIGVKRYKSNQFVAQYPSYYSNVEND